jgi:transposase
MGGINIRPRSARATERLSNAGLEGMNSTVRLLSHRARGYRRLSSLLAMITLVCGRIPVALPT